MTRRLTLSLLWLLALGFAACDRAPATLPESDDAAIRELSADFTRHIVAANWDALIALYTDDAVLMPPGVPVVRGRQAIQGFLKGFPRVTNMDFTLDDIDGRGDLAFVRGSYTMTIEVPGAPGPVTDRGKFIEIRRKQADGSWLISHDIFNSDLPPSPPPPAPVPESPSGS